MAGQKIDIFGYYFLCLQGVSAKWITLTWLVVGFMLKLIFAIASAASKKDDCFKGGLK